jgi:hypothetical protein
MNIIGIKYWIYTTFLHTMKYRNGNNDWIGSAGKRPNQKVLVINAR